MFNQNISDAKAFRQLHSEINEGIEMFVSSSKGYSYTDLELWDFPEDTPCEWILVDEQKYNQLAGHKEFVSFFHKDGIAMMVIIAPGSLTLAEQINQ